jgi:hypothetical protein
MNIGKKDILIDIQAKHNSAMGKMSIKIHTNQPSKKYKIVATTKDDQNKLFYSTASFIADKNGVIDLANQPPIEGDYEEIDSMVYAMQRQERRHVC